MISHDMDSRGIQIEAGSTIFNSIEEMKKQTDEMHKGLMEFISTLSEDSISSGSSSVSSLPCLPE
jgi:hypothetical protein